MKLNVRRNEFFISLSRQKQRCDNEAKAQIEFMYRNAAFKRRKKTFCLHSVYKMGSPERMAKKKIKRTKQKKRYSGKSKTRKYLPQALQITKCSSQITISLFLIDSRKIDYTPCYTFRALKFNAIDTTNGKCFVSRSRSVSKVKNKQSRFWKELVVPLASTGKEFRINNSCNWNEVVHILYVIVSIKRWVES